MESQKYLIPWFVIIAGLGLSCRPGSLEDMREIVVGEWGIKAKENEI